MLGFPVTDEGVILGKRNHTLGLTPVRVGKGGKQSQQRRFRERGEEGHCEIRAGSRMWGIGSGVREMVEKDKQG